MTHSWTVFLHHNLPSNAAFKIACRSRDARASPASTADSTSRTTDSRRSTSATIRRRLSLKSGSTKTYFAELKRTFSFAAMCITANFLYGFYIDASEIGQGDFKLPLPIDKVRSDACR